MKVFSKYVYGFTPNTWPLLLFSREGDLTNLLRKSSLGDIVVLVAAANKKTPIKEERGRLLAMIEFGRHKINACDVIKREHTRSEYDYKDGSLIWHVGLQMTKAWRFTDDPLPIRNDIYKIKLPMNSIRQAVELSETVKQAVLSLAKEEVAVRKIVV